MDESDTSNTSDVLSALVTKSNAAAAAVAASAATDFLNVSSTSSTIRNEQAGEEVEISKFTPLTRGQPSMTSSPGPVRTGSGSRSSSPSQRRRKRISRAVKLESQDMYAEYSAGEITTSGDEAYQE